MGNDRDTTRLMSLMDIASFGSVVAVRVGARSPHRPEAVKTALLENPCAANVLFPPMRNRWSDRDAAEFVGRYGERWGEPLALRVYTSRLIGADADLVMHGGG